MTSLPITPSPIRALLAHARRPDAIPFGGGLPEASLFPRDGLARAAAAALADGTCLQYAGSEGLPELRAWVAMRLRGRGVKVEDRQVFITNGSQHALQIALSALAGPGDRIVLDAPAYPGARQAAELCGAQVEDRELSGAGGDPDRLPAGTAAVVLMPTARNPTGATLDAMARCRLAAACARVGAAVIEDEAYVDLWYDAPPPAAICAQVRGVLTGSFSKILAPGLRLGWLAVPADLVEAVSLRLQATCLHANGLAQQILWRWLAEGGLDPHLVLLRGSYRERRDAMLAAIAAHLPDCRVHPPVGGMFCWLRLPSGIAAAAVTRTALDAGVVCVPEAAFHADGSADAHLRLCFASLSPQRIADGIMRLRTVMNRHSIA